MRRCPWGAAVSLCVYNPFWHHFPYFLHHFFGYRFCIDFVSTFHAFLSAQNHVFYCKTTSFEHFSLFQKSMKKQRFWPLFWHHFGINFQYFFGIEFWMSFLMPFFEFWSKMVAKWVASKMWRTPLLPSKGVPKTFQKLNLDQK